jgi:hypothetical protein
VTQIMEAESVRQAVTLLRSTSLVNVEHSRGAFVRNHPRLWRVSRNRYAESRQTGRTLTGLTSQITRVDAEPTPAYIAPPPGVDSIFPADRHELYDEFDLLTASTRSLEPTSHPKADPWRPWRFGMTLDAAENEGVICVFRFSDRWVSILEILGMPGLQRIQGNLHPSPDIRP